MGKNRWLLGKNVAVFPKCSASHRPEFHRWPRPIDPVRFIGNRSSGKMGLEIAKELTARDAKVILVMGPSSLSIPDSITKLVRVESAQQMYDAVMDESESMDIGVFAAAVADYTPAVVADKKIKKSEDSFSINLIKTKDILKSVGAEKRENQILVGFALETNNEIENAKQKLERKNLDFIVLNSLRNKGAGFQHDTNQISIIGKENKIDNFELKSKSEVAVDIVDAIEKLIKDNV